MTNERRNLVHKTKDRYNTQKFPLVTCNESHFNADENGAFANSNFNYEENICPDSNNPDIYFQGTKESYQHGKAHTFSTIKVKRCDREV